ncbi:MAG: hypothetical protein CMK32_01835 [Porticoccaceae bacterium]|nr:hypothetical protein [Porticoccaceae bacterium]
MANLKGKTVLITGANGFVGGYLVPALCALDIGECHATYLAGQYPSAADRSEVTWHRLDITDRSETARIIESIRPDLVFHLAAQSHVPTAFSQPALTWAVNLQGTINLLDATVYAKPDATFINVGTADAYGASLREGRPVDEKTPFMPLNPYAASKASADLVAFQYAATTKLKVIRARPFNHSGPGQEEGFVLPAFAAQIARIEAGLQAPSISVGNLEGERDFLHVHDVVDAYLALAEKAPRIPSGTAFNIASGKSVTMAYLLDSLLAESPSTIRVEQDPSRLRPADIRRVSGNNSAIRSATGWAPKHSVQELLRDLLAYWRTAIGGKGQS